MQPSNIEYGYALRSDFAHDPAGSARCEGYCDNPGRVPSKCLHSDREIISKAIGPCNGLAALFLLMAAYPIGSDPLIPTHRCYRIFHIT